MFVNTAWALLPPVIAIVLALITKEAYSSLFIGILVGAFLVAKGNPVKAVDHIVNDGLVQAISDNAGIYLFLILLGIIVALISASGASSAFGRWAKTHIKTRSGSMLATFVLGVLIFIDDYFNCLTVGTVMRPVTDNHKISRPKLAYLIDATAAPVCMIAPVSSWAAAVSGVANDLDNGVSGIQLFIKAIPYNFYSLLTFVFIIGLVMMRFDYGPMKKYEEAAEVDGELFALDVEEDDNKPNAKGRVFDMILPVIVLIALCTVAMLKVGGYFATKSDYYHDLLGAFGDTDSYVALPWGALITLILTIIYMCAKKVVSFKEAMGCIQKGFVAMIPPMVILTLAFSLKAMTGALGADVFVHNVMEGASNHLYSLLPAVIFVVAVVLAFASGTSWGTFGILIPIVTAIFDPNSPLLIIGISACLAGAVCGDHCSPISDTTIMSSAGAQCEHINHVSTQLPYALSVAGISFVMYIIAGYAQNAVVCLVVGAIVTIAFLFMMRKMAGRRAINK